MITTLYQGKNVRGLVAKFSGSIELINTARNLYRIRSFNISGADQPYDGAYHGLAIVLNQTLLVVCVKNDGSFMWGVMALTGNNGLKASKNYFA